MRTFGESVRSLALLCAAVVGLLGAQAQAATNTVHFGYPYFNPSDITIHPGDTVLWVHDPEASSHTVSICGPGIVPVSCSHTFPTPGTFPYDCTVFGHAAAGMTGVVRVAKLPPVAALLTNATRLSNGDFRFTVQSTANQTNLIQATTNVTSSTNWVVVGTVVPTNSAFTFTDTNASHFGIRLYRVVEP